MNFKIRLMQIVVKSSWNNKSCKILWIVKKLCTSLWW